MRMQFIALGILLLLAIPAWAQLGHYLTNDGPGASQYDVVIVDTDIDNAFKTTTAARSSNVIGVCREDIANGADGLVDVAGSYTTLRISGSVARGDYLCTSTTAGRAQDAGIDLSGVFAVALTAGADGETVNALMIRPNAIGPDFDLQCNSLEVGGGYGDTGVTISAAGVIQANGALTVDGASTLTGQVDIGGGYGSTGVTIDGTGGSISMDGNLTCSGDTTIDIYNNSADTTLTISNTSGSYGVNLVLEGTITADAAVDSAHQLGRAIIGYNGSLADAACFAHEDHMDASSMALRQLADGTTAVNAASGENIYLLINNSLDDSGILTSNGFAIAKDLFVVGGGITLGESGSATGTVGVYGDTDVFSLAVGAVTMNASLDATNQIITNIGNASCDFTSAGGLNLAHNLNMQNQLILNIGNAGTDFDSNGGLGAASNIWSSLAFWSLGLDPTKLPPDNTELLLFVNDNGILFDAGLIMAIQDTNNFAGQTYKDLYIIADDIIMPCATFTVSGATTVALPGTVTMNGNLLTMNGNGEWQISGSGGSPNAVIDLNNAAAMTLYLRNDGGDVGHLDVEGSITAGTTITATTDMACVDLVCSGDGAFNGDDITFDGAAKITSQGNLELVAEGVGATIVYVVSVAGTASLDVEDDIRMRGADFFCDAATTNIANVTPTTINFGGNAATINIGAGTSDVIFADEITVTGILDLNGTVVGDGATTVEGTGSRVEHHTAGDTLTLAESGSIHTNQGAGGDVIINLPECSTANGVAVTYLFVVLEDGEDLNINPDDADTILFGVTAVAGDSLEADVEGDTIRITLMDDDYWVVEQQFGMWQDKN